MKTIYAIISSSKTMAVLLLIFGFSIGLATFIENDYGTDAARSVIYNAKWFDLLMAVGALNIIAVTIKKKMYQRSKLTMLIFHLAFVVVIIGAGITRFFGTEGSMHIREGKTSHRFITSSTYLSVTLKHGNDSSSYTKKVLYSNISRDHFNKHFSLDGHPVNVKLRLFFERADESLAPDKNGGPHAHFVAEGQNGRRNLLIQPGDSMDLGKCIINFYEHPDSTIKHNHVNVFINKKGSLSFIAPFKVVRTIMTTRVIDTLAAKVVHPFMPLSLHYFNGAPLVLKQFMANSNITAMPVDNIKAQLPSAVIMDVRVDSVTKTLTVFGMKDDLGTPAVTTIDGIQVAVGYGSIVKKLPFGIHLNKFILKRYPGSNSPSWYESRVRLIDKKNGVDRSQRIYMNNILKYKGYRFYQTSYDMDEHGTILSVNHDGPGTKVTYLGYLCLAIGFFLSLFNKNSRFARIWRMTSEQSKIIKVLIVGLVLGSFASKSYSQDTTTTKDTSAGYLNTSTYRHFTIPVINKGLAEEFGKILVEDNSGRIKPMNTIASKVLRKVVRKEKFKGQTPDQVLLGMLVYPQYWQREPMILVDDPAIQKEMGLKGKYASFINFFSGNSFSDYILRNAVNVAYRKSPAYRTKYDNEIMRADERLNVCYMIYSETALKIFPDPKDTISNKWYSPVNVKGVFTTEDSVFTNHVLAYLYSEIRKSESTHNWKLPIQLVHAISKFQYKYGKAIIPSQTHINAEIFYNKADIFVHLMMVYMLVGFFLLILQFIHIFFPDFNLKIFNISGFVIILLAFLVHTGGLGLRWYIAGHAPWSNGYEALTFIAWATVLAGLIFSRKSSITLSVTAILASMILLVSHMSWMDPQITNLVPVLKSYWLKIHVADITSSYGFLGLGALLAAVNLLVMIFQNNRNKQRIDPNIDQITRVIELTLIIGLYMLTIGTFLGGVWANESWGRYWGWDPKETWALDTVIVYALILHIRLIPGLKGKVLFNILALAGFGSVVMTYFGVNYYLSGLHSYAKGEPMPIPPILYYSIASVILLCTFAAYNQARLKGTQNTSGEKDEE